MEEKRYFWVITHLNNYRRLKKEVEHWRKTPKEIKITPKYYQLDSMVLFSKVFSYHFSNVSRSKQLNLFSKIATECFRPGATTVVVRL